jgi:hypothetical protein
MTDLNLHTWHITRRLDYCPPHFIAVDVPLTKENKYWITEKLVGRYCFVYPTTKFDELYVGYPAFEDPEEATYFSLMWT